MSSGGRGHAIRTRVGEFLLTGLNLAWFESSQPDHFVEQGIGP